MLQLLWEKQKYVEKSDAIEDDNSEQEVNAMGVRGSVRDRGDAPFYL